MQLPSKGEGVRQFAQGLDVVTPTLSPCELVWLTQVTAEWFLSKCYDESAM